MADKKKEQTADEALAQRAAERDKQGFLGLSADPTPDENYTVDGVTSGAPTPETDEKAAAEAAEHARELTKKITS